jgi:hypothetical protein
MIETNTRRNNLEVKMNFKTNDVDVDVDIGLDNIDKNYDQEEDMMKFTEFLEEYLLAVEGERKPRIFEVDKFALGVYFIASVCWVGINYYL